MFCWISWLHVDIFSWNFYNMDSFDKTIENLLHLKELLHHHLLPVFNFHTHKHTCIHTYIHTCIYVNVSNNYPFVLNAVLTFIRCITIPWAETSCGQVWYYFGQVDIWSDPVVRVRLTFCYIANQPASQLQLASQPAMWQYVNLLDFGFVR